MPKMRQNAFGGRPDPMGERSISPRSLAAIEGCLLLRERGKGRGGGKGKDDLHSTLFLGTDF